MTRKKKVRGALVFCGCKLLRGLKQPNLLSCISAADSNPDLSGPKTRCHQGCTPARGSMGNPHLFWLCFWECPFSLACTAYSTFFDHTLLPLGNSHFLFCFSLWIFRTCINLLQLLKWRKKPQIYWHSRVTLTLHCLEARSLRWRCWQGWILPGAVRRTVLCLLVICWWSLASPWPLPSSSCDVFLSVFYCLLFIRTPVTLD